MYCVYTFVEHPKPVSVVDRVWNEVEYKCVEQEGERARETGAAGERSTGKKPTTSAAAHH